MSCALFVPMVVCPLLRDHGVFIILMSCVYRQALVQKDLAMRVVMCTLNGEHNYMYVWKQL